MINILVFLSGFSVVFGLLPFLFFFVPWLFYCLLFGGVKPRFDRLDLVVFMVLAIALLASVFSIYPFISFRAWTYLLSAVVLFFVLRYSESSIIRFMYGVYWGGMLAGIFYSLAKMPGLYLYLPFYFDTVTYGSFLVLLLPVALLIVHRVRGWAFFCFLYLLICFFVGSRMIFLWNAGIFAVLAILYFSMGKRLISSIFAGSSVLSLGCFWFLVVLKSLFYGYQSPFWDTFAKTERWTIWSGWINTFYHHPAWFGWGYGWGVPSSVIGQWSQELHFHPLWLSHAHNFYLNAMVQMGYLGAFAWLSLHLLFVLRVYVVAKQDKQWFALPTVSAMLFMVAWVVRNFPDDGMREMTLVVAMGLMACFLRRLERN